MTYTKKGVIVTDDNENMKVILTKTKRNTHAIGFNDEEYALIEKKAKEAGLYPRQLIMMKVKK